VEEHSAVPDLAGLTILVVDDDKDASEVLATFLQSHGGYVFRAHDAIDALAHLETIETIDVVITDLSMPSIDGVELTEAIRANAAHNSMPVIALSGLYKQDVDTTGIFDAFLAKPPDLEELRRWICYLTGRRRSTRDIP
jgi:two-component system, chemotaxis family, chemotaxis protein CheY